jgi:predicted dehydrogenase
VNNKVLIVGLGKIGMQYDLHLAQDNFTLSHSRAFSQHKDFDLVAAVDNKKEQRAEFSQKYSLPVYNDLSEALKIHSPDIVVIATSTQTHAEILSSVLKLSTPKIVLCEKPLSYHLYEAQEMVDSCRNKGVELYVNYIYRSDTGVIEVKNWLDSNSFDVGIKGVCWYSKGLIHNGSHFFNLLVYWLGSMRRFNLINLNIARNSDNDYEPDLEIEFEKGKIVFISAWEEAFSHYTIELLTPNGRIRYDERGATINLQGVINSPVFKSYKILDPEFKSIKSNMQHSQLNVVNQLSDCVNNSVNVINLCSGEEALNTLTAMQLIINEIKKNE